MSAEHVSGITVIPDWLPVNIRSHELDYSLCKIMLPIFLAALQCLAILILLVGQN
jgi:hypothetical protein